MKPGWYLWMVWPSAPNGDWWQCGVEWYGRFMAAYRMCNVCLIIC